jgi:hypothetical protein
VTVTNALGSTNSANAVLTVNAPPSISGQPTNVVTGLGLSATFRVTAAGTATLRYQWRFNGNSVAGATSSSLVLSPGGGHQCGDRPGRGDQHDGRRTALTRC